jgi:hypothetical protein
VDNRLVRVEGKGLGISMPLTAKSWNQDELVKLVDVQGDFNTNGINSKDSLSDEIDRTFARDKDSKGGIDFRFLPIVTESMDSLRVSLMAMPQSNLQRIDLIHEWSDLERLVSSGIIPSTERLKEYFAASSLKNSLDSDKVKIFSLVADILRIQEETCCVTDSTLKDILVVLGSGRSGEELNLVFAK